MINDDGYRKTSQRLCPAAHPHLEPGQYDIYPGFPLPDGQIATGFDSLATLLRGHKNIVVDGYGGVLWDDFRERLDEAFDRLNQRPAWQNIASALRPQTEIHDLIDPYLGGDDPLFGTRFQGRLIDFFDRKKMEIMRPDPRAGINILYGCGAALAGWDAFLVYVDLPKNEIQFRSRAASIANLGFDEPKPPKEMYKQFYFVDWVVLNRHKADLLHRIDLVVDAQRIDDPAWMSGENLRAGLEKMSRNYFRPRPWFEPGAWGGKWILERIPHLPPQVPNYAWSFELIVPENGLLFESSGVLLEVTFDCLMYLAAGHVLGKHQARFGYEFPIRYDFLDTFDGGNLSIQCHPRTDYIRKNFGESFTQDEAYYILDTRPGAQVYLGLQEGIDKDAFRSELERSMRDQVAIDIDQFVQHVPSAKHGLFLIPNGTVHGAGVNNLVLEISATPYIFTFKMYDWMRLDLDGQPRSLNIQRAFDNLDFSRQGKVIEREYISKPHLIEEGQGYRIYHLPTHPIQFYDVHRLEFEEAVAVDTHGSPNVLSLVEGDWVVLELPSGMRRRFNYAETFVIPAAAMNYRLINETGHTLKVVKTFLKDDPT